MAKSTPMLSSYKRGTLTLGLLASLTLLTSAPARALNCNLDGSGGTTPASGDVSRLLTIIVESQTGCAGGVCDYNQDGTSPNVGDVAALLKFTTDSTAAAAVCETATGGAVVGEVDTSSTVSGRRARAVDDLASMSAKLYELDAQGNLVEVSNVNPVSVSVDASDPNLATFQFLGVPETLINGVVKLENLGDPNAVSLSAILPSVDLAESTELRIDSKTDKEALVLKSVVEAGMLPKFVDPSLIKSSLSSEMLSSGTFNPSSMAAGIKLASQNLLDNLKTELGAGTDLLALDQLKNVRRLQFDTLRLKEKLANATGAKKDLLQQQLDSSQSRFESEIYTRLPEGNDKNPLEKFQQFQQVADANISGQINDPALKAEIDKRHKVQDFQRTLQNKFDYLFEMKIPEKKQVNPGRYASVLSGDQQIVPVSPLRILARVNQIDFDALQIRVKAIMDQIQTDSENPLSDPDDVVATAVGKVKEIRNEILTSGSILLQEDIDGVDTALAGLDDQVRQHFESGNTPAQVDSFVREQLGTLLSPLSTSLETRLSNLDAQARVPVKEAIRQILVALSTGRIPPHLVRPADQGMLLPPADNIGPPPDSDHDGFPDFIEAQENTDPLSAGSHPVRQEAMHPSDGLDNDKDNQIDEEKGGFNGVDDDQDGKIDEDVTNDFAMVNFSGVVIYQDQPVTGMLLNLSLTPPGPGMVPQYSTSVPTSATGEFAFTNIKAGRYFVSGYIDLDGQPGISTSDKVGFVGSTGGPQPIDIGPSGLNLTITNFVFSQQGAKGRIGGRLMYNPNPNSPSIGISGSVTVCRPTLESANMSPSEQVPSSQCLPPFMVPDSGSFEIVTETGPWLIRAFYHPPGDECSQNGRVDVHADSNPPQGPPSNISFSAPLCKNQLLNGPNGVGYIRGVVSGGVQLSSSATANPRMAIFLNPPKPDTPFFKAANEPLSATGSFVVSQVPVGIPFFLGMWREMNGIPGMQPGEPMVVVVNPDKQPTQVVILTASQILELGELTSSRLLPFSTPREVSGTVAISAGVAISTSAGPVVVTMSGGVTLTQSLSVVDVEVGACPILSESNLLGPPPPSARTASGDPTGPDPNAGGGMEPPPPCFFTHTDGAGKFKFFLNPGAYEVKSRTPNGVLSKPYKLEVMQDKANFGKIPPPPPDPNNPNPQPPPPSPLELSITGAQPLPMQ